MLATLIRLTNRNQLRPHRLSRLSQPHALLAGALGIALVGEYVYRTQYENAFVILLAAAVVAGALLHLWTRQDELRLPTVLAIALGFQLSLVLLHVVIGLHADWDSRMVYGPQGQSLLDGDYPRSEYPLGGVLLFAFEALVGGGDAERPNAFLMIPFQLLLIAGVWRSSRFGPWLATATAVWPMNSYWWEFRYDLVPAALLAVGLVLALRERWGWAGLALALGACFKWSPGLALLALVAWLLANRRLHDLRQALIGPVLVVLAHVPFAIVAGQDVAAAYTLQGGRSITAESIWYLPLHVFGVVDFPGEINFEVGAPGWADVLAIAVQGVALLAFLAAAATGHRLEAVVALAAMMPVAFFVTNRIFSPQFILLMAVAWAISVALLARSRREQLILGAAILAAATLNSLVYPYALPRYESAWEICSLVFFLIALATTAWVVVRARAVDRSETAVAPANLRAVWER